MLYCTPLQGTVERILLYKSAMVFLMTSSL
nr:MAG TPA: hypothetical protein [Caudoviricetes sp.]DAS48928.1 MAG TPA: hypothetical protein [Caudoviricetes sp.]